MDPASRTFQHPVLNRRSMLQAGSIGLLGLGLSHLAPLRALAGTSSKSDRAVIYLFLSGGLSQIDSFDPKPNAPAEIRGEFGTVATQTPGVRICEHLPLLAQCSDRWALVRSLTHPSNDHSAGHLFMLTGRSQLPPGFSASMPKATDWPAIAAIAGVATPPRNNLPPAAVLPEKLVHNTGRVIPGQFAGLMGSHRDPWFIEASLFEPRAYGAYPAFEFDHQERAYQVKRQAFVVPNLSLPEGVDPGRLDGRLGLLGQIDRQRQALEQTAVAERFDHNHQAAVALLTSPRVRNALDVTRTDPRLLDRYGNNAFGWSLLMARRLVEVGVNLVQVNLGNNETWDTHGNAFPHLKEKLFPPTDRALSALIEDLDESGLLDSTLIVMAGEFGRTPKITGLPQYYKLPGRDHWGAVQTVFFAGGGVRGGSVVGSSDKTGGYPATDPQTPENMAATIYHHLGLPATAEWHDAEGRPHAIYHGQPIHRLF
jgi:uncharacterized protein (DUF1501 family)